MKRSKGHVWIGIAFVLAAIIVAGGIYVTIRLISMARHAPDVAASAAPTQAPAGTASIAPIPTLAASTASPVTAPSGSASVDSSQSSADEIGGTYAEGIASHAACEGPMWDFDDDTFDYEGNDGEPSLSGRWHVADGRLYLTALVQHGSDGVDAPMTDKILVIITTADGIKIGNTDYIRCAPAG